MQGGAVDLGHKSTGNICTGVFHIHYLLNSTWKFGWAGLVEHAHQISLTQPTLLKNCLTLSECYCRELQAQEDWVSVEHNGPMGLN